MKMELFLCSTMVTVGNGKNTPFWKTRWLDGVAPKDLAPHLFSIARYKGRSVHRAPELQLDQKPKKYQL
jgi:hypothetical protein